MIIKNVVVGPLEVNCYILGCEDTKEAAIIDPGDNADEIIGIIEKEGLKPKFAKIRCSLVRRRRP